MDRCPKDEPTAKNLVCKKAFSIPKKNWENLLGDGSGIHPVLAIGGLREVSFFTGRGAFGNFSSFVNF